jgi:photosystem II stability/assembly factor-like uncharacterized protein
MPQDSYQRLQDRRDRKRRNRIVGSAVLALVIAAGGATGAVFAFRGTGALQKPGSSNTPSATAPASPSPSVSPGPTTGSPGSFPPQPSGPIQFVDAGHGWWVDQNGSILATTDGGKTSSPQYSGSKITTVQFVDSEHGWGSGESGLVRTVDGGANWETLNGPGLSVVQFVDPNNGFGISPSAGTGRLLRSDDGGSSWRDVATPGPVESECFIDTTTGWVAAGTSAFRTTDGGANWSESKLGVPEGEPWTATVGCATESDAWLLLTDGGAAGHVAHVLFHTGDGTTWQPVLQESGTNPLGQRADVFESPDPYPGQMAVTGPNGLAFVGWCPACGNSVDLFRTEDGGKLLAQLELAAPDHGGTPQGVSFVDPNHGFVLLSVRTDKGDEAAVVAISGEEITVWSNKTVP